VVYGVGARLDGQPELLFALPQVDAGDLVAQAAAQPVATKRAQPHGKVRGDALLVDVFGIEMAAAAPPVSKKKTATRATKRTAPTPIDTLTPAKVVAKKKRVTAKTKKTATPLPGKPAKPDKPVRSNKKAKPV